MPTVVAGITVVVVGWIVDDLVDGVLGEADVGPVFVVLDHLVRSTVPAVALS